MFSIILNSILMFFLILNRIFIYLLFKWWKKEDLKNHCWNLVKSNSCVSYYLSDEKVRIWKIVLEILLKSNSFVFYTNRILMYNIV